MKLLGNNVKTSPECLKKISHPGQEISLYSSKFSKEVSQLTDRNSELFGTNVQTSQECVTKFQKDLSSITGYIPTLV